MTDWDYKDEPVVGHHIAAKVEEREPSERLKDLAKRLGVELREQEDWVRIREGDVDWEDTREVKMTISVFQEMAEEILEKNDT